MSRAFRTALFAAFLCTTLSNLAFASGHGHAPLAGPLAPLDAIADGHTVATSLNGPIAGAPSHKIGQVEGTAGGQRVFLRVERLNYAYGAVEYSVSVSQVPYGVDATDKNTVNLHLDRPSYLLKAMSDEILLDTGFFLGSSREIARFILDGRGNITGFDVARYNGLGIKRLEFIGNVNPRIERFGRLHGNS